MNWRLFLESMSDSEFDWLDHEICNERRKRADRHAETQPELNGAEMCSALAGNRFEAIKSYRNRTDTTLMIARAVVDKFLANENKEEVADRKN